MYVLIKLLEGTKMPFKSSAGAAAYDLFSYEDIAIHLRTVRAISTGVSMEIEPGYFGRILPRSGLVIHNAITTDAGVINSDFRGIVKVCLKNIFDEHFIVKKGDKIAQIVFLKAESPQLVQVDKLSETARGHKGFGSTGTN